MKKLKMNPRRDRFVARDGTVHLGITPYRRLINNLRQMLRDHPQASDSALTEYAESGGFNESEVERAIRAARKPRSRTKASVRARLKRRQKK